MHNAMGYPLSGLKVLDFSRVLAGPFATRMLCDLGAEVLKVEPPEGDISRLLGRTNSGASGFYLQQNIGKRNICLDLKAPGARMLILDLARTSDIVVENFRPGVMERFGIGWEDLRAANPRLVMLSISGFGQNATEKARAAYAPVIHAEAGLISRQGEISGSKKDLQLSFADTVTGLHGLVGLLVALRSVEQTGVGQHIDMAMMSAVHASDDFAHWALDKAWPRAPENLVWEAPEGKHIILSSTLEWIWHFFSSQGELSDPAPDDADAETQGQMRLTLMQSYIRSFDDFDSLTAALDRLNIAWGLVREFGQEAYDQPSAQELGVLVDVEDDIGQTRQTVQSPYRFSRMESGLTAETRLARRGEDNHAALREWLGLDEDRIKALTKNGVLLCEG